MNPLCVVAVGTGAAEGFFAHRTRKRFQSSVNFFMIICGEFRVKSPFAVFERTLVFGDFVVSVLVSGKVCRVDKCLRAHVA